MSKTSIPAHYNPKGGEGAFRVYHAGKMDYRVIDTRTGSEVAQAEQLGLAMSKASRAYRLDKEACNAE